MEDLALKRSPLSRRTRFVKKTPSSRARLFLERLEDRLVMNNGPTVPYPLPLTAVAPLGSLVYDPSASGTIGSAGDTDSFTLNLDAGQTVSLDVTAASGLQPTVVLLGPSGQALGNAAAAGPGQEAVLQAVPATEAGTYTVTVGGAGATTGAYTMRVVLNAALEGESHGGPNNDAPGSAQDLDPAFLPLVAADPAAQRAAVLGSLRSGTLTPPPVANGGFETGNFAGWTPAVTGPPFLPWQVSRPGVGSGFGMAPTAPQEGAFDAWNGFDGAGPMQYVLSQVVTVPAGVPSPALSWKDRVQWNMTVGNPATLPRSYTVEVQNPATNATLATLYSFQTGTRAGNPTGDTGWLAHSVSLTPFARSTVRLVFRENVPQSFTGPGQLELDDVKIVSTDADFYRFTLGAGETATLALKDLTGSAATLALQDAAGRVVATGVGGATNVDQVIANFTAAAGTYYAVVSGGPADYNLVVARNAAFDTEPNNTPGTAEDISGTNGALGAVAGGPSGTITLNAVDSGWWNNQGTHDAANKNYVAGGLPTSEFRDYFVFNLAGVAQTITSAQLNLSNPAYDGYGGTSNSETYTLYDVSTPVQALEASGANQPGIFNDLGSGTVLGVQTVSAADDGRVVSVGLNAAAVAMLNGNRGGTTALGGALTPLAAPDNRYIFGHTGGQGDVKQLVLTYGDTGDYYAINVTDTGHPLLLQTTTPDDGPGQFVNTLNPHIQLYDPSGALVASGVTGPDGRNEFLIYWPQSTGAYRVRVTAEGGTSGEYFLSKDFIPEIHNLTLGAPVINENDLATLTGLISDPDPRDAFTLTVNWGDGSVGTYTYAAGTTGFGVTHCYLDNLPGDARYTIALTLSDNRGGLSFQNDWEVVKNVAPSNVLVTAGPATINENDATTLSGSFTDPGTLDTHTVDISWGDGSPDTALSLAAGVLTFAASHQYLDNPAGQPHGSYPINVTVTDKDGGTGSGATAVEVDNLPPTAGISGPTDGVRGQTRTFTLGATDPSPVDQAAGFTFAVHWNDGTPDQTLAGVSGLSLDHVFTSSGSYNVQVTATDKDGGVSTVATQLVTVTPVALQPDPLNPGTTDLVAGGTLGDDTILFTTQGNTGAVQVVMNGASLGTFTPTGRIIAFGQAGNDDIEVSGKIGLPAWLYGGDGNDTLRGGGGNSVLIGGAGDDDLTGGKARNLLIGGAGADRLGGQGDNILIAGTTAFDAQETALAAILAEWASDRDYATRVANISGTGTGPRLNGNYYLIPGVTVLDDSDPDRLGGGPGEDWFFANVLGAGVLDKVTGQRKSDVVTDI
jgi:hypothetical protein